MLHPSQWQIPGNRRDLKNREGRKKGRRKRQSCSGSPPTKGTGVTISSNGESAGTWSAPFLGILRLTHFGSLYVFGQGLFMVEPRALSYLVLRLRGFWWRGPSKFTQNAREVTLHSAPTGQLCPCLSSEARDSGSLESLPCLGKGHIYEKRGWVFWDFS